MVCYVGFYEKIEYGHYVLGGAINSSTKYNFYKKLYLVELLGYYSFTNYVQTVLGGAIVSYFHQVNFVLCAPATEHDLHT